MLGAALLLAALLSHVGNLVGAWNGYSQGADFATLMSATRYIWHGFGYAPMTVGAPEQFLTGAHSEPYPPTFFLLMAPWAFAPAGLSIATWILVEELALALLLVVVWKGIGAPSLGEGLLAGALVLVFLPVRENLFEGQMGIVIALAAVAAYVGSARGHPVLGGIPLGVVIALKLTPALLLPYLLWRRGWRVVASASTAAVALGGLTLAVGWGPRWGEYVAEVGPLNRGTAFIANQSINGVLLRAWNPAYSGQPIPPLPPWLTIVWYTLALALLGVVFLLVTRLRLSESMRGWVEFSIILLALPLVQPFAWFHHHAAAVVAPAGGDPAGTHFADRARSHGGSVRRLPCHQLPGHPIHRLARPIGGQVLGGHPLLLAATSLTVVAVLLAIVCLSRAREPWPGGRNEPATANFLSG